VPSDDEIRELCIRASLAQGESFSAAITELKIALRNRIENISNYALSTILQIPKAAPVGEKKDGTDG
jgi:predicted RNase H-like HicB family nuclease